MDVDYARLLVTWQDPATRAFWRIGVLTHSDTTGYEFEYITGIEVLDGFVPFLGLDDVRQVYRSSELFPFFAERMMDPGRVGFDAWLQRLHMEATASPMEILAKSHGSRGTDTVQLFAVPRVDDERFTATQFFVNGVRHVEGASDRIEELKPEQRLSIKEDPENDWDVRALIVTTDGAPLGFIPGPLLDYVHVLRASQSWGFEVVQVNPVEMGNHFRLLVQISGQLPADYDVLLSMKASIG